MAGRTALVRAAAIGVLDLAVGLIACAADDALAGRGEADSDIWNGPLELGENVTPQIDVARIFRRQMNGNEQRLAKLGERPLIGGRERVAPILGDIDRLPDLRRQAENCRDDRCTGDRPNKFRS